MPRLVAILRGCLRGTGLLLVLLGVLFWTGRAAGLISLHIAIGVIFVLSLVALAVLALRQRGAGTHPMPVVAIAWAVLVWAFGFAQEDLLPGATHWVVKTLHLLVGLVAIGLGEAMGRGLRDQHAAGPLHGSAP